MTITEPCYVTREYVKKALNVKLNAYADDEVDNAIEQGSRNVDQFCRRIFYPRYGVRYFPWPDYNYGTSYRLWLDENELISLDTLVSGGDTIASGQYFLEPVNSGPPFDRLELDISASTGAFTVGSTSQRNIVLTGLWGYSDTSSTAGTLVTSVNASIDTVVVSNSSKVGVGDLIRVGDERMLVIEKGMVSTGDTLQSPMTDSVANVNVAVTDGTQFSYGEIIALDSERMFITGITGNTLSVRRAYDGTVLASHTGSTIYVARSCSVVRGAVGSTASSHLSTAEIQRYEPPRPVVELAAAYAIISISTSRNGYVAARATSTTSRGTGSPNKGTNPTGAGVVGGTLDSLEVRVKNNYGRKGMTYAV